MGTSYYEGKMTDGIIWQVCLINASCNIYLFNVSNPPPPTTPMLPEMKGHRVEHSWTGNCSQSRIVKNFGLDHCLFRSFQCGSYESKHYLSSPISSPIYNITDLYSLNWCNFPSIVEKMFWNPIVLISYWLSLYESVKYHRIVENFYAKCPLLPLF